MKKLLSALLMMIILVTLSATASAEGEILSMQYVPRTQHGALFYLDVTCDTPISAAVFELHFDPSIAEYRSVYCDDENADAMGNADGDTVKIAYSHRASVCGKLYRLSFKALKTGTVQFTLHIVQAVDKDLNYLTDIPDFAIEVKLGKDDVVSSETVTQKKSAGKSEKASKSDTAQKKSYSGSKSELIEEDVNDGAVTEPTEKKPIDYSGMTKWNWFTLGAASALFIALAIIAGFLIGRKCKKKPDPAADDGDDPDGREEDGTLSEPEENDPFDELDNSI